jgi:membrane protease YdiL (CAAX protease family)
MNNNRYFDLANQAKHKFNVVFLVLIALALMYFGQIIGTIISFFFVQEIGKFANAFEFMFGALVLPFGFVIVLFFIWVKFFDKRKISSLGFEKNKFLVKYLRGFLLGFLMLAIAALIMKIAGIANFSSNLVNQKNIIGSVFLVLIGWIVQGASEEIMTRGWLMQMTGNKHNIPIAVFISSTLFAALHLGNNGINYLSLINLVIFGLFASLFVIWEGGLWGICALHTSWNWAQGNIFGYQVSGTIPMGGSILKSEIVSGQDLWTGGIFGVEGGLICTVVLLIGISILTYLIRKRVK